MPIVRTTSAGVDTTTSITVDSASTTLTLSSQVVSSTPDDSDGLAATIGGEAIAIGEDTLAVASVTGLIEDGGVVTSLAASADMLAASEAEAGGTAYASAFTFAEVAGSPDLVITTTTTRSRAEVAETGVAASAESSTDIAAYDFQLGDPGPATSDSFADAQLEDEPGFSAPATDLDGNVATVDFDALALGENTLVTVDAYALVIEDELSLSGALITLAVD